MSKKASPRKGQVKDHYEQWPFPGTDFLSREGLLLLRYMDRWIRQERPLTAKKVRIIDVGCGTGHTTLALARNFPEASFLGLDISQASLRAARRFVKQAKTSNVAFRTCDLRRDLSSLGKYRVVLCLGVLHHTEDPRSTFRSIARLAEPGGYLVLWLYGSLGRFRHRVNQKLLRLLTRRMNGDESLEVARAFVEDLGPKFAAGSGFYTPRGSGEEGLAWLLQHPPWLADQMIPAHERAVTLPDILRLFRQNQLELWRWLGVPLDLDKHVSSPKLKACFDRLPVHQRLIALDYLIKPSYYFVVGKKLEQD